MTLRRTHRCALTAIARSLAAGGILGPVAFVAAWVLGAIVIDGSYSSAHDAISRLAAVDTNSRSVMTAGFVVFGFGMVGYAAALRRSVDSSAWVPALATGIATLGVAATPLDRSESVDQLHGVFAVSGYITLAAIPLLAFQALRRGGHGGLAVAGLVSAGVTTIALVLTTTSLPTGAMQRLGLTATDIWVVASAWKMLRPAFGRSRA